MQANATKPGRQPAHPFLAQIKTTTQPLHDQIERTPLLAEIFAPDYQASRYAQLLGAMLGFYRPLERQLRNHCGLIPQFVARLKSAMLTADCQAFGYSNSAIATLPECFALPTVRSEVEALGVMYVLEGSTMGGRVITKRLQESLTDCEHGLAFFSGYGRNTMAFWSLYRDALVTQVERHPETAQSIVAAANETFLKMELWLTQCSTDSERH